jgi:hypothetical protein
MFTVPFVSNQIAAFPAIGVGIAIIIESPREERP